MSPLTPNELKSIITDAESAELLVKKADEAGTRLATKEIGLSTSQIRALFGEVRQIEAQWNNQSEDSSRQARRRLILLKPKMAYRARKERGRAVQELVAILSPAVDEVLREKDLAIQKENFQRFVEFFEAILAYHKAAGGK